MGQTYSYPEYLDYESAGVLFIDERNVLGGYQPKRRFPCITGIGGGKEDGDGSYVVTAFREMFEELFGWKDVPQAFLKKVSAAVRPSAVFQNGSYVIIALSFEELERILRIMRLEPPRSYVWSSTSPFYHRLPRTCWELIRNRKILEDSEIQQLILIPLLSGNRVSFDVAGEFLNDIKMHTAMMRGEREN